MNQKESIDDNLLMAGIAKKEAASLEQLYDRYEKPIYSFAYRMVKDAMVAEEVVQELFFRIWNSAERFDESSSKLTTWMFAITRNIAVDILRKKQSRLPHHSEGAEPLQYVADERQDTETQVEWNWIGSQVKAALHELNEDQKIVMEMIYYQGYTQQEVSEMRRIPLGTVKSRVRLALKQLKGRLAEIGAEGVRI